MSPSLVRSYPSFTLVRLFVLTALTLLLAGWSTCSALFVSCQTSVPQPQVTALSPNTIPGDMTSVRLTVDGTSFVPQSQILWNGNPMQTTFLDSTHLQTVVTQHTLAAFGGTSGTTVKISVGPQDLTPIDGCPIGGGSSVLILSIN
jgi:hypothetical protein